MSCTQLKRIHSKSKALFLILTLASLVFNICPAPAQEEQKGSSDKKAEEQGETIYEPGAALLEIFKTDSIDKVSDLVPVIRTLWKRDLVCTWLGEQGRKNPWYVNFYNSGDNFETTFLVPERYAEVGLRNPYIARFSFYYEAKQSGKYGFNIWHGRNACRLVIESSIIAEGSSISSDGRYNEQSTTQGVCKLEKGFHRVEFWLISSLDRYYRANAYFAIKVLTPDGFDAVPITKDMLLMKPAKPPKP